MSDRVVTAEQVAELMLENSSDYTEYIIEHLVKSLCSDPKNLQSWMDWFNKEGEFPDGSVVLCNEGDCCNGRKAKYLAPQLTNDPRRVYAYVPICEGLLDTWFAGSDKEEWPFNVYPPIIPIPPEH